MSIKGEELAGVTCRDLVTNIGNQQTKYVLIIQNTIQATFLSWAEKENFCNSYHKTQENTYNGNACVSFVAMKHFLPNTTGYQMQ